MALPTTESVRASVLEALRSISKEELFQRSERVTSRVLAGPALKWAGKNVALYRSMDTEIQLGLLENGLLKLGARLCYPRISDYQACTMCFAHMGDPRRDENWIAGPYNVMEPIAIHEEVESSDLDVIVVPGVAFGRGGERIGRGKGYYDRYLSGCSHAERFVLALDFQLFQSLPQNSWDQRVQHIITESEEVVIQ